MIIYEHVFPDLSVIHTHDNKVIPANMHVNIAENVVNSHFLLASIFVIKQMSIYRF